jgi:hypothetical protein
MGIVPGVINNDALAMYVAAAVALVVLGGFFWYLWSIDRGVAELRRRLNERPAPRETAAPLRPQRRVAQEQNDGNTRG